MNYRFSPEPILNVEVDGKDECWWTEKSWKKDMQTIYDYVDEYKS